jgi:predicted nucleic acid-binding protein
MNAIDTNVWIYSYDTRDPQKQQVARQVGAATRPFVLPWQVGCECLAATRKLLPFGFTAKQAWEALDDIRGMANAVALPDPSDWDMARDLQAQVMLSLWDALLLATCIRHGVTTLFTEDFGSPRTIRGVQIVNPFATPAP